MRREEFEFEKGRFTLRPLLILFATLAFALVSCEKDPEPEPEPDPDPGISAEVLMLNNWIWDEMGLYYLWENYIPDIDPTKEPDPEEFFYKLLYEELDRDSWITDDYDALIASFDGVELTTGMVARPWLVYSDADDVMYVVLYVTPDSPAENAGVQRGDIIIAVDGEFLTKTNYRDLFYQTTATFQFGEFVGEDLELNGKSAEITAIELNQNPLVHSEIIDYQGKKIGYFVYTQFTGGPNDEWEDALDDMFIQFISENVEEVIVDLRYNGGGYGYLSAKMASALVSAPAMENEEVFVKTLWNDGLYNYWLEYDLDGDGAADGQESEQLVRKFPYNDLNMDLQRVYFLTTDWTASASEQVMIGLYPYMDVIQVGTTTYGKCYGSYTLSDTDKHNWAMQPIITKYANANGYTDFVNGIIPDYYVEEYSLVPLFGSFEDPLLATALEDMTGVAPEVTKSAEQRFDFEPLPVPRKRLPEMKIKLPGREELLEVY